MIFSYWKEHLDEFLETMRFAPPGGHRCVCQRTLGGDNGQRFMRNEIDNLREITNCDFTGF